MNVVNGKRQMTYQSLGDSILPNGFVIARILLLNSRVKCTELLGAFEKLVIVLE